MQTLRVKGKYKGMDVFKKRFAKLIQNSTYGAYGLNFIHKTTDFHESNLKYLNKNIYSIVDYKYNNRQSSPKLKELLKKVKDNYNGNNTTISISSTLLYGLKQDGKIVIYNFISLSEVIGLKQNIRKEKINKLINGY